MLTELMELSENDPGLVHLSNPWRAMCDRVSSCVYWGVPAGAVVPVTMHRLYGMARLAFGRLPLNARYRSHGMAR